MSEYRTEVDSLGEVRIPKDAMYGVQTQRAVDNFPISGRVMRRPFLRALGLVKAAAARANGQLGHLPFELAERIYQASLQVAEGEHDGQFPVDVYQTGSGTSTNMNANEVIAFLANSGRLSGDRAHPNDHVNFSQSSNDVIPTTIQVSAVLELRERLVPAIEHLCSSLGRRAHELRDVVKTGRTHLMDAMPLRFDQELGAWQAQLHSNQARLGNCLARLQRLPLGGTAVGTGINADERFAAEAIKVLNQLCAGQFSSAENLFEGISAKDEAVELSGHLKTLACSLMKISNDLRWMNSGPLAGLGEISLPALQPGSSIMPGKVNPVILEAVAMVCARVTGNDVTVTIAAQSGNFQLNVMLPLIADTLLESIDLLTAAMRQLADRVIDGFSVRHQQLQHALQHNPILVTALNAVLGYDKGAALAKRAYSEGRPILEVARELVDLPDEELRALLDPMALTRGGIHGGPSSNG